MSQLLSDIALIDTQISDTCFAGDGEELSAEHERELDNQSAYTFDITNKLTKLNLTSHNAARSNNIFHSELKLPNLICGTFSGEKSKSLEYATFLTEFNNIIGLRSNLTGATKLTYLKTYLKGYAFKVVNHLQVTDDNYNVALSLLEKEFFNRESLIDDSFSKLLNAKPKYDVSYLDTKLYISEVRCLVADLKLHGIDLLSEGPCKKLTSHIVVSRLPVTFKRELAQKLNNNFPDIDDIFEHYVEVIRTLNMRVSNSDNFKFNPVSNSAVAKLTKVEKNDKPAADQKNESKFDQKKSCKFCNGIGHSMFHCRKYSSHVTRVNRCKEIKLCSLCTSSKHAMDGCPRKLDYKCNVCNANDHISALCPKFQLLKSNTNCCLLSNVEGTGTYLLPTISVKVSRGSHSAVLRCLLDTGSQRSYISSSAARDLHITLPECNTRLTVNTFVNTSVRNFLELGIIDIWENAGIFHLPVLIDDNFHLEFEVAGLSDAIGNISARHNLADDEFHCMTDDRVKLDMLIGIDSIQFFSDLTIVKCMNGTAFQLCWSCSVRQC